MKGSIDATHGNKNGVDVRNIGHNFKTHTPVTDHDLSIGPRVYEDVRFLLPEMLPQVAKDLCYGFEHGG